MEKNKFKSFGKVKRKITSVTNDKDLRKLYEEKVKNDEDENIQLDEKINKKILEYQVKEYERKLLYLNELKKEKGRSASVFKLKEKIVGSKKAVQEAVSMKDPATGELILENEKLKEASVRYVSNLLTNRSPKEEYRKEFNIMESMHEIRMNDSDEDDSGV